MRVNSLGWMVLGILVLLTVANGYAESLQPVAWQALPFYTDSDWPGPQGQPASLGPDEIVLQGRPARSLENYQPGLSIECDVMLDQRFASDGSFDLVLLPPGEPLEIFPKPATFIRMIYRNSGAYSGLDELSVGHNNSVGTYNNDWSQLPIVVQAGVTYHLRVDVAASGQLSIAINGHSYPVPAGVGVLYPQFQLQIASWQPTNVWRVRNFRVTANASVPAECVLTCPRDIVVTAAPGQDTAIVAYPVPVMTGDCIPAAVVVVPASGSVFGLGTTVVSCTASNEADETAQCSFLVTVHAAPPMCTSISSLIERVRGLALDAGLINALTNKLEAAQRSLEAGRNRPCANQLQAFINQVRALQQTARLDAVTADELVACARSLQPVAVRKHGRRQ